MSTRWVPFASQSPPKVPASLLSQPPSASAKEDPFPITRHPLPHWPWEAVWSSSPNPGPGVETWAPTHLHPGPSEIRPPQSTPHFLSLPQACQRYTLFTDRWVWGWAWSSSHGGAEWGAAHPGRGWRFQEACPGCWHKHAVGRRLEPLKFKVWILSAWGWGHWDQKGLGTCPRSCSKSVV